MPKKQKQNAAGDPVDGELAPGAVHWQIPTKMLGYYVVLVMLAVGNHLYYTRLDGQATTHQSWKTRAGTAFANVFAALFAFTMGLAFAPRTWRTLRRKYLTLDGIGKLFTAPSNLFSILCTEILVHAKISMLIAALVWVTPLIPIFAPGSISVVSKESKILPISPIQINNFNFSQTLNVSDPTEINVIEATQLRSAPAPSLEGSPLGGKLRMSSAPLRPNNGPPYSVYTKPTNRLTALISEVAYSGQIIQAPSPCGDNCNFTQSFVGPTYQCVEIDPYDISAPWCSNAALEESLFATCPETWGDSGEFLNTTSMVFYEATNSSSDFCTSVSSNPAACNFTAEEPWENGNLWVRYKYLPETLRPQFHGNTSVPANAWRNLSYRCDQWDARFDLTRTYINSTQQVEVTTTPLNRTQYGSVLGVNTDNGFVGSNNVSYVNFAIHETLFGILSGRIFYSGDVYNTAELDGTSLVEAIPWPLDGVRKPKLDLGPLVEQLHTNVTISLLAVTGLVYLSPVHAPDATLTGFQTVFQYDKKALLLTYGLALLLGLIALAVGMESLFHNGVGTDLGFLSILLTTRNRSLDELARGACLGADPIPESLKKRRVRFAAIKNERLNLLSEKSGSRVTGADVRNDLPHAAFVVKDTDSEVEDIKKGEIYV